MPWVWHPGTVRYRIMTLPLSHEGTWAWDFTTPDGWVLVSVLDGPLADSARSGWTHVTVLLWQAADTGDGQEALTAGAIGPGGASWGG